MSREIDERVVSMQFDNKNFEKNVSTTMSTLDKLKSKLKFGDSAKEFQNLNKSVKDVNFNPLAKSIETVKMKFSAMEIAGITALTNITNRAMAAGERMIKAFTIDPVKTGLQEYETQINAVQTILANTSSKGTTLDQVNAALDELNTYADKTIYNFTEMTRNIGTFTAAGVDLNTSVSAIQGIANLAAVSGSTSQQASTAMYQLSQALAAGRVSLMDWNSVVNAGMGGEVFQNALKQTARDMGTDVDAIIDKYGTFRESLTQGEWLTTDVLTSTLGKMTKSGAVEYLTEFTGISADSIANLQEVGEKSGYTSDEFKKLAKSISNGNAEFEKNIVETLTMANTAEDAATKVKTFTQLMDTLKESVQSGWTQTWELIIGDFEQAKKLWTGISDFFGKIIGDSADRRNKLLEGALGSPFGDLIKGLNKVNDVTTTVTKTVQNFDEIVNKVIAGDFGDGEERVTKLTEAGYEWAHVQNLVNEKLGSSVRHASNYSEAQDEVAKSTDKVTESQKATIQEMMAMTDVGLTRLGLTTDEIAALRELEKAAADAGVSVNDVLADPEILSGRNLLLNGLKNIGMSIYNVFSSIGTAWREIFAPMTSGQLYDLIAAFHKFSLTLEVDEDMAKKLTRTFKGLFAIIDIITSVVGGAFKFVFRVAKEVLAAFDMDILDVTANIGDAIVKFRDWIDQNSLLTETIKSVISIIRKAIPKIQEWWASFKESELGSTIISNLQNGLEGIKQIGLDLWAGLKEGLENGFTEIPAKMIELGQKLIEAIKGVLGIASPSKVMIAIGGFIVAGLIAGLAAGGEKLTGALGDIGKKIIGFFEGISWDDVMTIGIMAGIVYVIKKIMDAFGAVASPLEGLGDIFDETADAVKRMSKAVSHLINAAAFTLLAEGAKIFAEAVAILVAAVVGLALMNQKYSGEVWEAVGQIAAIAGVLAVIIGGLAFLADKMKTIESLDFAKLAGMVISIGVSMLMLAGAVKIIGSMDVDQANKGLSSVAQLIIAMGVVVYGVSKVVTKDTEKSFKQLGKLMTKMAVALLLMAGVIKIFGMLSEDELYRGTVAIGAFVGIVALLSIIGEALGDNNDQLANMMIKMATSMLLLTIVIKLIGGLSPEEIGKGAVGIAIFVGVIALLTLITQKYEKQVEGLSKVLLGMSAAMLIMVAVVALLGNMELGTIVKGGLAIIALGIVLTSLVKSMKGLGKEAPQLALTLLSFALSVGLLGLISVILGHVDTEALLKGGIAVAALGAIVKMMVKSTQGAADIKGTMIGMAVAIGVMALAMAGLAYVPVEKLAASTVALSAVLGMFAVVVKSTKGLMGDGMKSLLALAGVIAVVGGVVYLIGQLTPEEALSSALSLSSVLLAIAGAMKIVQFIPVSAAITGAEAILAFAAIVGAVVGLIGTIDLLLGGGLAETLEAGVKIFGLIGEAIGAIIGGIAKGIMDGVAAGLESLGVSLGKFATDSKDFFTMLEKLPNDAATKAILIADALLVMTGASLIDAIASFLSGGESFSRLGTELSNFASNAEGFFASLDTIDPSKLEAATSIAGMIGVLTSADLLTGIADFFGISIDFSKFGTQLKEFGTAVVEFSDTLSEGNGINEDAVKSAAYAGSMIAALNAELPGTGGVLQMIMGEKDLGAWSEKLTAFGTAIVGFSQAVSAEGAINSEAVQAAADAGSIVAALNNDIPTNGGLWSWIAGDNDLGTWSDNLTKFGTAILNFSTKVGGNIDSEGVESATAAGEMLAALNNNLPTTGGVWSWLAGDNDLEDFGEQLVSFGTDMKKFSDEITGNGGINVAGVNASTDFVVHFIAKFGNGELATAVQNGYDLLNFLSTAMLVDTTWVTNFVDAINELAKTDVAGFVDAFSAASSQASSVGSEFATLLAEGISSKTPDVISTISVMFIKMMAVFSEKKDSFTDLGDAYMTNLIDGMSDKESSVKNTASSIATKAAAKANTAYVLFYQAGIHLADGLISGINLRKSAVYNAGYALGKLAVAGEKEGQQSNSPSKLTIQNGKWLGEGLVIGMQQMGDTVYQEGYHIGDTATKSISDAVSRIQSELDSDMDSQPTIRPIMDLSDVVAGTNQINRMMQFGSSIDVMSNVRAVSHDMNSRYDSNSDVISAIERLGSNMGGYGDTYNINGVTYDDGSAIQRFAAAIIQQARIEGRV